MGNACWAPEENAIKSDSMWEKYDNKPQLCQWERFSDRSLVGARALLLRQSHCYWVLSECRFQLLVATPI